MDAEFACVRDASQAYVRDFAHRLRVVSQCVVCVASAMAFEALRRAEVWASVPRLVVLVARRATSFAQSPCEGDRVYVW